MPQLPRSPSLEHLKNQAKALFKAQRSGDVSATKRLHAQNVRADPFRLADAQWVVARKYGFPNWARLKVFVEAQSQTPQATKLKTKPARKQFVLDLAEKLVHDAERGDAAALGERFAVPLWAILRARTLLLETGRLSVVVGGLVQGLEHPKPRVRFNCAGALDHLADERAALPLRQRLDDPVPRVRRAALHALGCDACKLSPLPQTGDFMPKLVALALYDPSVRVRRAAVPVLGTYCADAQVVAALQGLARDADTVISRSAKRALRRLGNS